MSAQKEEGRGQKSETPRTDAFSRIPATTQGACRDWYDFACDLERELNRALHGDDAEGFKRFPVSPEQLGYCWGWLHGENKIETPADEKLIKAYFRDLIEYNEHVWRKQCALLRSQREAAK